MLGAGWLAWSAVLCVFAVDTLTPVGVTIEVLYPVAVVLSTMSEHDRIVPLGIVTSLAVLIGMVWSSTATPTPTEVINRVLSIGAVWAVVAVAGRLRTSARAALTARTDQLEMANEDLEQFIHAAAHDLQAPVRAISSYIHLLGETIGSGLEDHTREYFERVIESSARMSRLLNDLLDYGRIGWDAEPEAVDLKRMIDDVVRDVVGSNGKDVNVDVAPMPTVVGHPTYLRLAFVNLVDNAWKFAKPDEPLELRIRAEHVDGAWIISVADNGIGFPDSVRDRVFSVFQRLPDTAGRDGSGIGLAHCRKIARMHRGHAWAESAPGEGSTFYLSVADPQESLLPATVGR